MVTTKQIQIALRAPFGIVLLIFEYCFIVFLCVIFFPAGVLWALSVAMIPIYPIAIALGVKLDFEYKDILFGASIPFWLPVVHAWNFVIKGELPDI